MPPPVALSALRVGFTRREKERKIEREEGRGEGGDREGESARTLVQTGETHWRRQRTNVRLYVCLYMHAYGCMCDGDACLPCRQVNTAARRMEGGCWCNFCPFDVFNGIRRVSSRRHSICRVRLMAAARGRVSERTRPRRMPELAAGVPALAALTRSSYLARFDSTRLDLARTSYLPISYTSSYLSHIVIDEQSLILLR